MGVTASGYPYPEDTDPVASGAQNIKALATAVESKIRATAAGRATIVLTNAASAAVAITFPAGRFTAPPAVTASAQDASVYILSSSSVTATAANLTARYYGGTATTGTVITGWSANGVG